MSEDFTQRATCKRYYKFENASDLGEDNQGTTSLTNNNGVTQSSTIPDDAQTYCGVSATKSGSFASASSQYLSATHANSTDVDDLTALTAVFWIRFTSNTGGYQSPIAKTDGADGWYITENNFTNLGGRFADNWHTESAAWSINTWYFCAVTYSQTSDLHAFYRGTETSQVAMLGSGDALVDRTASTAAGFTIGSIPTPTHFVNGLICEASVFSEGLSLAELQEIQVDGMEGTPAAGILAQMLQHHGG